MHKYTYGPLVFVTRGMNEDEGNYFWTGKIPVGYDESGVPIDDSGNQCLDVRCPLHPAYEPNETFYCEALQSDLPTLSDFQIWFDDNFLIVSDNQVKKYIIKWWMNNTYRHVYEQTLRNYSSVSEITEAVWPQDEQTS